MIRITELTRQPAPAVTPQALALEAEHLWISSRDLGTFYKIDPSTFGVVDEVDPPGVVWDAVLTNDGWRLTVGKGLNDDRYVYRYDPGAGFAKLFSCPEFAGSYLSFDGSHLFLSRWYKGQIHRLDEKGETLSLINVGAEISGQTFADGFIYVLRGTEQNGESWTIARLDPREERPTVTDLAAVPFACRSLAFDGTKFWTNHRAANEIVSFSLPR